jgi:hypothetical protein
MIKLKHKPTIMKKLIKNFWFIALLAVFFIPTQTTATHYMGGEITWECMPNGNFRFVMKAYRECYTTGGGTAANYGNTAPLMTQRRVFQV